MRSLNPEVCNSFYAWISSLAKELYQTEGCLLNNKKKHPCPESCHVS